MVKKRWNAVLQSVFYINSAISLPFNFSKIILFRYEAYTASGHFSFIHVDVQEHLTDLFSFVSNNSIT